MPGVITYKVGGIETRPLPPLAEKLRADYLASGGWLDPKERALIEAVEKTETARNILLEAAKKLVAAPVCDFDDVMTGLDLAITKAEAA